MFRRFRWVGLTSVVIAAAFAVSAASIAAPHSSELGSRLVNRFFRELQRHDVAGLRKLLSPAFQIQRANGTRLTKTEYLHNLPTILGYKVRAFRTTQSGGTVVVTYQARTVERINGKKYTSDFAPRLSVFSFAAHHWQLVGHANFNPIA